MVVGWFRSTRAAAQDVQAEKSTARGVVVCILWVRRKRKPLAEAAGLFTCEPAGPARGPHEGAVLMHDHAMR